MCQQCDFDKIKSRDIKIRNPLKITGFIEDIAFSYWAVKPIIYHRKVNGRDESIMRFTPGITYVV